ncbi:MAG: Cysteine synthase [Candidatus Daviesbacteria bacterium GW2011_GWF2_38_6]|uniref:Cysteine synthase n=1 Tax=Candidatus Daviesbacteria bacterium GW2011_GWF2_38_6 TaxID=1618432 RepID=A0A0G0KIV5_9BACT|nr:MAG: Cysteine synthase [Candidatus Daviesbacteria bacterium GW2011_GWF2_38_6]
MAKLGLEAAVVNKTILGKTAKRFKERKIQLPTFEELSNPSKIPADIVKKLQKVDANEAHPLNLYRINWYNDPNGKGFREVPYSFEAPKAITGVDAKIVIMPGAYFPMVQCHKVLAAYGCLAPRLITGQFDPTTHKAIWPSTGNYCRGGVAVSRIMDCHGVAILPEEMSEERFNWLKKWCLDPKKDIHKTHGCESNVKEIYDKCKELDKDSSNIIFNQFCEFGNAVIHYICTGKAMEKVFTDMRGKNRNLNLRAFTSATGSAGIASDITPGEPIDTTQLGVYRSFSIRLNLEWPRAITAFLKNPFLGTGYSSLGIATDNDFLRSLGEVGMLGTAVFILIFIEIIKKIVRLLRENDKFLRYFSIGTLSLILAFVINGLFIDVFEASKVASLFWMIVGLNLSVRNFK